MSNDLVSINNNELALLPGSGRVLISAVMARINPMLREAALCAEQLQQCEERWRGQPIDGYLGFLKLKRELLIPRTQAVVSKCQDLRALYYSGEGIEFTLVMKLLSVLYATLPKPKSSDDNVATMLKSTAALFDPTRDAVGVDLKMWELVPRHPVVVILGVESLIANNVFSPAASEVADECRKAYKKLGYRLNEMLRWVGTLIEADLRLFRDDRDEWRNAYQDVDSIKAAIALIDLWKRSVQHDEAELAELETVRLVLWRMQYKIEEPEVYEQMYGDIEAAYSDVLYDGDVEDDPPPKLQPPAMPKLPWKIKRQMLKELIKAGDEEHLSE